MGPLKYVYEIGTETNFVFAFLIGIGFGIALEQGGFGNAKKLAYQFYFRDMTVFKVMFTAIITAMTGIIFLSSLGYLNMELVYLNPTYLWPGIVGGLVMGVGFVIGGYCPGTGLVGLATMKVDAFFNIMGAMGGMVVYGEVYPLIQKLYMSGHMGDRVTLPGFFNLAPGTIGFVIVLIALAGFWGSEVLEKRFQKQGGADVG